MCLGVFAYDCRSLISFFDLNYSGIGIVTAGMTLSFFDPTLSPFLKRVDVRNCRYCSISQCA